MKFEVTAKVNCEVSDEYINDFLIKENKTTNDILEMFKDGFAKMIEDELNKEFTNIEIETDAMVIK